METLLRHKVCTHTHTRSLSGSEVRAVKWVSCGAIGAVTFRSVIHPAQTSVFSHNIVHMKHMKLVCVKKTCNKIIASSINANTVTEARTTDIYLLEMNTGTETMIIVILANFCLETEDFEFFSLVHILQPIVSCLQ